MPGLFAIISDKIDFSSINVKHKSLTELVIDKKVYSNFYIERFTNSKFLNDKLFLEDDEMVLAIEGIILNFKELQNKNGCSDYFRTIKKLYKDMDSKLLNELKGEFSGVLYDKTRNKWMVFTNQTGSKPIYYYKSNDSLIFSSEVKVITKLLKANNFDYNLDETGAYLLLTHGFMLEDYTLIKEVKKLKPGNCIVIENNKIELLEYFRFNNSSNFKKPKNQIIDELDELFIQAVRLEYEKDLEYSYKHISTLSGGLDSRMNVMLANKLGYKNALNITFSQSDYLDEKIAKKIASDINNDFLFYSLNNGNYLQNISDVVNSNDGLVHYAGAAHSLSMLSKINFTKYGLLHTGQIGDAVIGGTFLSADKQNRPKLTDGVTSRKLINRVNDIVEHIQKGYETAEMYKFYSRAFNGALNGYWITQQFTEFSSPFLDRDFLSYCLEIDPEIKYGQKIYIEWLLTKHPELAQYIWERTRTKPSNFTILPFVLKKWRNLKIKLFGVTSNSSMNPFDYWYNENEELRKFINDYYKNSIYLLDGYPQLQKDCKELFMSGTLIEKTQVMTLLEVARLYFGGNDE